MNEAAEGLEYEQAARIRDMIVEIENVSERRKLSSVHGEDVDVFGIYAQGGHTAVCILVMRGGPERRVFAFVVVCSARASSRRVAGNTVRNAASPR